MKAVTLFLAGLVMAPRVIAGDPISYQQLTGLPAPPVGERIAYGEQALQFGELRLPGGDGPHAVVVLIHGGCWYAEYNIDHIQPLARAITDLGYATWALEYRRIGDDGGAWPGTFADIAAGTDFLQQIAPDYALDLKRVISAGHSAGGQLALWLAARDQLTPDDELYQAEPLSIHGVLGLAAAADLDRLAGGGECGRAAEKLMGGLPHEHPSRYAQGSPKRLAPLSVRQILINGEKDETWSPIAESYYRAALLAGDDVILQVVPEAAHFDLVAPQEPAWPFLARALHTLLPLADR